MRTTANKKPQILVSKISDTIKKTNGYIPLAVYIR